MSLALWRQDVGNKIQCLLCHHSCSIAPGKVGLCGVRMNKAGTIQSLVDGFVASVGLDPIEKKPLYHYLPGSKTYSFGTMGCNFACKFCQNFQIARLPSEKGIIRGKKTTPAILIKEALRQKAQSIAFTYNEPTVFYELFQKVTEQAPLQGLDCVLVSNGYQTMQCLSTLYKRIHAANIDLKSMRESFYRSFCKAQLSHVLDNLKVMVKMGWWVEVTTLVIPGANDSPEELRDAARFIRTELGPHVPWHLSRFHGAYQMLKTPQTPIETLERARNIALEEGLYYVYIGNADTLAGASTLCPGCQTLCIGREGARIQNKLKKGLCPKCKRKIEGIWTSLSS